MRKFLVVSILFITLSGCSVETSKGKTDQDMEQYLAVSNISYEEAKECITNELTSNLIKIEKENSITNKFNKTNESKYFLFKNYQHVLWINGDTNKTAVNFFSPKTSSSEIEVISNIINQCLKL